MEQKQDSPQKPSLASGLSVIEKALELRWTLQLMTAVLFADLLLVWRTGQNIAHWSTSTDQLLANSGFLITGILAFAVLMSIVMPLAAELFRQLVWQIVLCVPWPAWARSESDWQEQPGQVLAGQLREHALRKGDKLLLELYEKHHQRKSAQRSAVMAAGHTAFSVLVLGCMNLFANMFGLSGTTLLQDFAGSFGQKAEVALIAGAVIGVVAIKHAWFSAHAIDRIYYPPLYDEIRAARKKLEQIGRV